MIRTLVNLWVILAFIAPASVAWPDLTRDGRIGPGASVQIPAVRGLYVVEPGYGKARGQNLFHSFSKFDLGPDQRAIFKANRSIRNVISRVTGGRSLIQGAIEFRNPGTGFILMNPAGISFADGAQIDVDGSFTATTADRIDFDDNSELPFLASPEHQALSAGNISGFGFLSDRIASIEVANGRLFSSTGNLALVGGDLTIEEGSRLDAPRGWVSLISAGAHGSARAGEKGHALFNLEEDVGRGRLSIFGELSAYGLDLESGSLVVTSGLEPGLLSGAGGIDIDARGTVLLDGGWLSAQSESATAPRLTLQGNRVELINGSSIEVSWNPKTGDALDTRSENAIELQVGSLSIASNSSIISSMTGIGTGAGGSILIDAERSISIHNGERTVDISASTRHDSHGASIKLQAPIVRLAQGADVRVRMSRDGGPSGGTGGDIEIRAEHVEIRDGAQVKLGASNNALSGAADAGSFRIIDAKEVLLEGSDPKSGEASGIFSGRSLGTGRGGDIEIEAERLRITAGARISSESDGGGPAGNISLHVQELWGDHAQISTKTPGGTGGNIHIGPGSSVVLHESEITTNGGREGGRIESQSEALVLSKSRITTIAEHGPGGAIALRANTVIRDHETVIDASSGAGDPGEIIIGGQTPVRGQLMDLDASLLAAERLLQPQCAVRPPQARSSLVLAARAGVASSPEGWLMALETDSGGLPDVALEGTAELDDPNGALAQAVHALREGRLSAAATGPETRAAAASAAVRARGLRSAAQRKQAGGNYRDSVPGLLQALLAAEAAGDLGEVAAVLGSLGNAYLALQRPEAAEDHLRRGIDAARRAHADGTAALLLNNLANHLALQGRLEEALASYQEAWELARTSGAALHAAQALANGARAALRAGRAEQADRLLAQLQTELRELAPGPDAVFARIHGAQTELLRAERAALDPERVLRVHAQLMAAVDQAVALGSERALSYALGHLGALYERDRRHEEALYAAERALLAAQRANAPEAEYRWQALAGRNLWLLGRRADALAAYRKAVAIAESLRLESAPGSTPSELAFRERIAPVYLALVELLLREAGAQDANELHSQDLLRETRSTMEALKAAELREYFHDDCTAELERRSNEVDRIEANAAVVYPILLPERIQLLVSHGGALRAYSLAVEAEAVAEQVNALRRALEERSSQDFLAPAQQLYRWLVEPFAEDLERAQVRTLVFVPYGILRAIPLAALHDGEAFLVQRLSLAVTPGLSLTAPRSLEPGNLRLLAGGVSQSVQGFPELPHASAEVRAIGSMYRGQVLLNEDFTQSRLRSTLEKNPFSVVHIASHTSFSAESGQSYVITHDGSISIQELSTWVGRTRFRDQPLELIVLSACETAAGDPQTALGLAGIAVQSGARSALGSLWRIDDEAAKELTVEFYAQLRQAGQSRAEALRQAQLALLRRPEFAHPSLWSAFLLIGSWL